MNSKIRILLTIPNFNTAGSGKVVYDLANGLDKKKFDVEIACGDNKGAYFKTVESLGLPIHIIETKTPYKPYLTLLWRIKPVSRFYKKNKYDIVHSWQWNNDWTEALAARRAGVKWIYTKKAMGFASKHWKIKSRLANFIVTINDEMRDYFPNKKAQQLIPLGLDTTYYASDPKLSPQNTEPFKIITVANLVPVKGIEVLINAVKILKPHNVKLTVLGDCDNDYGNDMKQLVTKLRLDEHVEFLGKRLDVRPFISESHLYVIPTLDEGRKEGMPMALVEAMSMGIPLLGSNITGIKFVLKDFQELLFEAGNAEILANKIDQIRLMSSEERLALGKTLRDYCVTHYSMEAFITAHETLYQQLSGA